MVEVAEFVGWEFPKGFLRFLVDLAEVLDGWEDELRWRSKELLHEGEVLGEELDLLFLADGWWDRWACGSAKHLLYFYLLMNLI